MNAENPSVRRGEPTDKPRATVRGAVDWMKGDATQTLLGIQLFALALTTTVALFDGVRRIEPDARVVGN